MEPEQLGGEGGGVPCVPRGGKYPLVRQSSGTETKTCFCTDAVCGQTGDLRLGCRCLTHYGCLVQYIRVQLEDRHALRGAAQRRQERATSTVVANPEDGVDTSVGKTNAESEGEGGDGAAPGIDCPYASAGECNHAGHYAMTTADLNALVDYGRSISSENALTAEESAKLVRWLSKSNEPAAGEPKEGEGAEVGGDEEDKDAAFICATTKPCPGCGLRASHFHGHGCHHIGGCRECGVQYCYRCLKTAQQNFDERGSPSKCLCGGWSTFCQPLRSSREMQIYIKLEAPHSYPTDTRCGCVLCPDCAPGKPCPTCHGCVVCNGHVLPGPRELGTAWVAQTEAMRASEKKESLQDRLIEACRAGELPEVRELAAEAGLGGWPVCLKETDRGGRSLLHAAVDSRSEELVRYLCEQGARINMPDNEMATPFCLAAASGMLDICKLLTTFGAMVNAQSQMRRTPLHNAVALRNLPLIKFLVLECRASCDLQDDNGTSPLETLLRDLVHWPDAREAEEAASILMIQGRCTINFTTKSGGQTPLQLLLAEVKPARLAAATNNRAGVPMSVGDRNVTGFGRMPQNNSGYRADYCCGRTIDNRRCDLGRHCADCLFTICEHETVARTRAATLLATIAKLLVSGGADVYFDGCSGSSSSQGGGMAGGMGFGMLNRPLRTITNCSSSLHLSCQFAHPDVALFLIDRAEGRGEQARLHSKDTQGRTPLSHAAQRGLLDVCQRLLLAAPLTAPEEPDDLGNTILMYAAASIEAGPDLLQLLCESGAAGDVNFIGSSPTLLPRGILRQNALMALLSAPHMRKGEDPDDGTDENPSSIWLPRVLAKATFLLDAGTDIRTVNASGRTVLHLACMAIPAVSLLDRLGVDDAELRNARDTPEEGGNRNVLEPYPRSPLQIAVAYSNSGAVQKLLAAGPCNINDGGSNTPLDLACSHAGQLYIRPYEIRSTGLILSLLVGAGADVNCSFYFPPLLSILSRLSPAQKENPTNLMILTDWVPRLLSDPSLDVTCRAGSTTTLSNRHLCLPSDTDCDWSALHYAAILSQVSLARALMNRPVGSPSAEVDAASLYGTTPLMLCCAQEESDASTELLQLLLAARVDVSARDAYGRHALMYACRHANVTAARTLLGVAPHVIDLQEHATLQKRPLWKKTRDSPEAEGPEAEAGAEAEQPVPPFAQSHPMNPVYTGSGGITPWGASNSLQPQTTLSAETLGYSALHHTVDAKSLELVLLLAREGGADLLLKDAQGRTPLALARHRVDEQSRPRPISGFYNLGPPRTLQPPFGATTFGIPFGASGYTATAPEADDSLSQIVQVLEKMEAERESGNV